MSTTMVVTNFLLNGCFALTFHIEGFAISNNYHYPTRIGDMGPALNALSHMHILVLLFCSVFSGSMYVISKLCRSRQLVIAAMMFLSQPISKMISRWPL